MPVPENIPADILLRWHRGQRLVAIQELCMQSGLNLKEAKKWLEASSASGLDPAVDTMQPDTEAMQRLQEIESAIARRDKVDAIRLLRAATGLGLAEAKEHVDTALEGCTIDWEGLLQTADKTGTQPFKDLFGSRISPGAVPRRGMSIWLWWLVIALIGLIINWVIQGL